MASEKLLTICTVSFGHGTLIQLNVRLATNCNPAFKTQALWRIADNAPRGSDSRLCMQSDVVELVEGCADISQGASHQHALALNALIASVETRYLLVLDPDFYLLMPGWIERVLSHMQTAGLAFFGAPWHPRYIRNYRYFPAVHCMFVDLQRIPREALDFRPRLDLIEPLKMHQDNWFTRWIPSLRHRRRVPWDTGVRVYDRFANRADLPSQCVTPVFRISSDSSVSFKSRMLELMLPDSYCYFPKRRDSFTRSGFHERGIFDRALPELWEETFWQEAPFGLHVRRSYASHRRSEAEELNQLPCVLETISGTPVTGSPAA